MVIIIIIIILINNLEVEVEVEEYYDQSLVKIQYKFIRTCQKAG